MPSSSLKAAVFPKGSTGNLYHYNLGINSPGEDLLVLMKGSPSMRVMAFINRRLERGGDCYFHSGPTLFYLVSPGLSLFVGLSEVPGTVGFIMAALSKSEV